MSLIYALNPLVKTLYLNWYSIFYGTYWCTKLKAHNHYNLKKWDRSEISKTIETISGHISVCFVCYIWLIWGCSFMSRINAENGLYRNFKIVYFLAGYCTRRFCHYILLFLQVVMLNKRVYKRYLRNNQSKLTWQGWAMNLCLLKANEPLELLLVKVFVSEMSSFVISRSNYLE